jgi:hypothetical protein
MSDLVVHICRQHLAGHADREIHDLAPFGIEPVQHCTESSIQTVLSRKGLVRNNAVTGAAWKNEKKDRDRLCCRRPFVSEGAHNRLCPRYTENSRIAA